MERIRTTKPQRLARPAGPSVGMSMGYGKSASPEPGPQGPAEPEPDPKKRGGAKAAIVAVAMTLIVAVVAIVVGLPLIQGKNHKEAIAARSRAQAGPGRAVDDTPRMSPTPATSVSAKVQSLKAGGNREQETALQRAAECRYRSPLHIHTIQEDETLSEVAGTYGVRVRDLIALNPELDAEGTPGVGTAVRVCPELPPRRKELQWYTAQPRDTWSRLAAKFKIREQVLRRANPSVEGVRSASPDPGQRIAVPRRGKVVPGFPSGEGSEHQGSLHNGVRLPFSEQYELKRPALNYGSPQTIAAVRRIADAYWKKSGGHKLLFGDLSRVGGGPLVGHRSHQQGRDIDIGIPLRTGERYDRFVTATRQNLHHERAWLLVKELVNDPNFAFVFVDMSIQAELYNYALRNGESEAFLREIFQYPRVPRDRYGIIRHFRGHVDHFHIRFRE